MALKGNNTDITNLIVPHLDRHMVLPLLEFLEEHKLYSADDMQLAKLDLVSETKMVDSAVEEYTKLYKTDKVPAEMQKKRTEVYQQLRDWKEACGPLLSLVNDTAEADKLRKEQQFNFEHLSKTHKITQEHVASLYRFAKLNFDCGHYRDAADFLFYFSLLSSDAEQKYWAQWGKLAAEILMVNYDNAKDDLEKLKESIDMRVFTDHLQQLQQRTWLIHWGLFIFFSLAKGKQDQGSEEKKDTSEPAGEGTAQLDFDVIEFLTDEKMLNAIQLVCPHVLRYLTAAVVITKRRKFLLKDIARIIVEEKDNYSDPVTEFVRALWVSFDFELAHKKLNEAAAIVEHDFFLHKVAGEFVRSGRELMFETYCRIHKCIDISELAKHLDLKPDVAETHIVEYIKNLGIDAKIDSKKNQVVMEKEHPTIYGSVIDKTKGLMYRTQQLMVQVQKKYQSAE